MIKLSNDKIENFVSFISISDIPSVELYIVPGFDTVETDDGQVGFACYVEGENRIIVLEGLTNELLFTSIAHEYYHQIQMADMKDDCILQPIHRFSPAILFKKLQSILLKLIPI